MKFAKVFQHVLDSEDLPPEWVAAAVQYKALKKCIARVVTELEQLGLEKDTLRLLLAYERAQRDAERADSAHRPKLVYSFEGSAATEFVPKITISLSEESGLPLDAHIAPSTRAVLENLVATAKQRSTFGPGNLSRSTSDDSEILTVADLSREIHEEMDHNSARVFISDSDDISPESDDCGIPVANISEEFNEYLSPQISDSPSSTASPMLSPIASPQLIPTSPSSLPSRSSSPTPLQRRRSCDPHNLLMSPEHALIQSSPRTVSESRRFPSKIEIHLHSDSEFFHMLTSELVALDQLQEEQVKSLTASVSDIASRLPHVSSPLQKRSDLYVWREIFRLYLDAGIFFSSLEQDHGERSVERAKEQMLWFTNEVKKLDLIRNFKRKESRAIFESFWQLNLSVLQSLQFYDINQTATTKILKKFDKQTSLSAREVFPEFFTNSALSAADSATNNAWKHGQSIARAVCYTMADQLLSMIPQLDDYICPVCYLIAYRPIRLDCGHVFCIRCLVKLQRQAKDECPICRQQVVLEANGANVDTALQNHMKLYFPKEVKQKLAVAEKEIVREQFNIGESRELKCCIM
ncbi:SPX domain-containing protein [Lipomyces oligophaga]|uniref:SPX domain-containing protein n=1 Tax=Lipomyces oligophaga TaxID=45792 RepID=UPI0034CF3719